MLVRQQFSFSLALGLCLYAYAQRMLVRQQFSFSLALGLCFLALSLSSARVLRVLVTSVLRLRFTFCARAFSSVPARPPPPRRRRKLHLTLRTKPVMLLTKPPNCALVQCLLVLRLLDVVHREQICW